MSQGGRFFRTTLVRADGHRQDRGVRALLVSAVLLGLAAAFGCSSTPALRGADASPEVKADVDTGVTADADASADVAADIAVDVAADVVADITAVDVEAETGADAAVDDAASNNDAVDASHAGWGGSLDITAPPGQHVHTVNGINAGVDTRAKPLGKLVVELGVDSGSYASWAGKRGFHVMGVKSFHCPHILDWTFGVDYAGDCRANAFDGLPHGTEANVDVAHSIATQVRTGLIDFQAQFPDERWGFFLNADGTVRWSDVIVTGYSYGATLAARIGSMVRVDRVVARTTIRDNSCGTAQAPGPDPNAPPSTYYDPACTKVARWLGEPHATPIDRYFSFTQTLSPEFGDGMFSGDFMHLIGPVVPLTGASAFNIGQSHRFTYQQAQTTLEIMPLAQDALNAAYGVPLENQKPPF